MPPPKDPIKREMWIQNQSISHTGKIASVETLKKMSISHIAEKNHNFGKILDDETKLKISVSKSIENISEKTRKNLSDAKLGEKNPNWKGGVSFEPYCVKFNREFKNRVRAFFGYRCVECEKTQEENGRLLDVHHVNYDKMMCCNDIEPLFVVLCKSHNAKANYNREYWEKHYTDVINNKYGGMCYLPKTSFACSTNNVVML